MTPLTWGKALLAWIALAALAAALGVLREGYLVPMFGARLAYPVATLWACAAALMVGFLYVQWARPVPRAAFATGALWLALALVFEIGFFHFVAGRLWSALAADYHPLNGRLLPLWWLSVLLGPYLTARLVHRSGRAAAPGR